MSATEPVADFYAFDIYTGIRTFAGGGWTLQPLTARGAAALAETVRARKAGAPEAIAGRVSLGAKFHVPMFAQRDDAFNYAAARGLSVAVVRPEYLNHWGQPPSEPGTDLHNYWNSGAPFVGSARHDA